MQQKIKTAKLKKSPMTTIGKLLDSLPGCVFKEEEIRAAKEFLMPFGKHAGKPLEKLPFPYVEWLLKSCGDRGYKEWHEVYAKIKLLVDNSIIHIPSFQKEIQKFDLNKVEETFRDDVDVEGGFVNHPAHYQGKKFEVIDIIEDFELSFNLGNALKYILRAGKKGNTTEDLKKAIWYIKRSIEKQNLN